MEPVPRIPPLPEILAGRRIAILGGGTVGQALGSLLREAGLPPVAVTCRDRGHATAAALATGGEPLTDNAEAASRADLLLVTAADRDVAAVAVDAARGVKPGTIAAHTSGALGLAPLAALREAGAYVGSIHPLQAFASVEHAVRELPGSVFGVTADHEAESVLDALVALVGGVPVPVAEDARPLYHAAACLASNYLVALEDLAIGVLTAAGFDDALAAKALEPLLRGTVGNVRRCGTTMALTGPIVRGDVQTVRGHLAALAGRAPDALPSYRALGEHAVDMAIERGSIDEATADELRAVLGGTGEAPCD